MGATDGRVVREWEWRKGCGACGLYDEREMRCRATGGLVTEPEVEGKEEGKMCVRRMSRGEIQYLFTKEKAKYIGVMVERYG